MTPEEFERVIIKNKNYIVRTIILEDRLQVEFDNLKIDVPCDEMNLKILQKYFQVPFDYEEWAKECTELQMKIFTISK